MGNLLVASSVVSDPVFAGSVGLIVHQDDENVIGVILNRPLQPAPEAFLSMLKDAESPSEPSPRFSPSDGSSSDGSPSEVQESDVDDSVAEGIELTPPQPVPTPGAPGGGGSVHFGGPVSGPVVALHQSSRCAEAEMAQGLYVAAQRDHLERLVRDSSAPYRLIVGHLRWSAEQLEDEIERGLWHPLPADADAVFLRSQEMWPRLIRRATSASLARWIQTPDVAGAGELN